ncbi:HPr family phosphocarrier protein [Halopiger thermotolerans]
MDGDRVGERVRARTVTVATDEGLHARPAANVVETVEQFDAEVRIAPAGDADNDNRNGDRDDDPVAATSVLAVTSLGVASGDDVRLVATGDDATAALDALEELLS